MAQLDSGGGNLLTDYSKYLNIPSADGNSPGGIMGGNQDLQPQHYLPTTNFNAPIPGAQNVTPALVNFNPKGLPSGYSAANTPADWQNIIASNPDYMQWQLGASQRADTATAARRAGMRSLAIRFGGLPA